jgi:hypothetical protein
MTKCETCKFRIKMALREKVTWTKEEILNEIDLIFVDILNEELQAKLEELKNSFRMNKSMTEQ